MTKTKRKSRRKKSDSETTASLLIKCHYESLGLRKIWNQQRVERMCSFLRMTYEEMGALIGIQELDSKIVKTRKLPLSACILLTMLEKQYLGDFIPDAVDNLFKFTED